MELDGPFNLVGTEASGTSVHMARGTVNNGLDSLNIGLPSSVGTSVGVGNLNTKGNALATIITLRHSLHLLSVHMMAFCDSAPKQALRYDNRVFKKKQVFFYNFFSFFKIILIFPFGIGIMSVKIGFFELL